MLAFRYFLYTRTRIGYYYHRRDIAKAQEKLGGGSHSELTLFSFGGTILSTCLLFNAENICKYPLYVV